VGEDGMRAGRPCGEPARGPCGVNPHEEAVTGGTGHFGNAPFLPSLHHRKVECTVLTEIG